LTAKAEKRGQEPFLTARCPHRSDKNGS
jgi:hypothetical protein